jgi:hypothetical protein
MNDPLQPERVALEAGCDGATARCISARADQAWSRRKAEVEGGIVRRGSTQQHAEETRAEQECGHAGRFVQ